MLAGIAVFLFTGCIEEQVLPSIEQESTLAVEQDLSKYPVITDEEFYQQASGFVTLPEGVALSNKVKFLILEKMAGIEHEVMINSQFHLEFSKEDIHHLETEGKSLEEHANQMLERMGIDPTLPEEEQIRQILELEKNTPTSRTNYGHWGYTYVPHYYQYDYSENPNGYLWCGHTTLKGVAHKHGQYKSLSEIHQIFCYNSPNGYCTGNLCSGYPGRYCSRVLDLYYATNASTQKWYNYDFPNSSKETVHSLSHFYQLIRDGVDYDKPVILPSTYGYGGIGHFYSVVAYVNAYRYNGSIDLNRSYVYLRDAARRTPSNPYYDMAVPVSTFYNYLDQSQILIVEPNN